MDKSEIRKMYNGDFICKKKKIEHNGIIPLIYKRIICVLWKGHNYIQLAQKIQMVKDFLNVNTVKNNMCGKLYYLIYQMIEI